MSFLSPGQAFCGARTTCCSLWLTHEVGACACVIGMRLPLHRAPSVASNLWELTDTAAAFLCHSSGDFTGALKCAC